MTIIFDDNLRYYGDVAFYLWYLLCDVSFSVSQSHSLSKVFRSSFLVMMRKVNSRRSCSARDKAGMERRGINY
jgi:hypothetical protein